MFDPPKLRDDLPRYPQPLQLLRVTSATVPGPSGGASTGPGVGLVPPSVLYISSTQQLRTDTQAPRDREPCLVVPAPNADGATFPTLSAGYYLGRLAGSFNSLPVYEVASSTSSMTTSSSYPTGTAGLPGLTEAQIAMLNASLTPTQIGDLNNLTACQLQVLLQLPVVNIQQLSNLTPTQLQYFIDNLTYTQLQNLAKQIPTSQITVLSSAYPLLYQALAQALTLAQAQQLLGSLSSQQLSTLQDLTPSQLQTVAQLTPSDQQKLTGLTPSQVKNLLGSLPLSILPAFLNTQTTQQQQQLTNAMLPPLFMGQQSFLPLLPVYAGQPSTTPSSLFSGYTPVVVDQQTGKVWAYLGGQWANLSNPSSPVPLANAKVEATGTTTTSLANVFTVSNGNGLHGSFALKNTGGVNSLNYKLTAVDMFGTSRNGTVGLTPGQIASSSFDSLLPPSSVIAAPYTSVTLEVIDASPPNHTTYDCWRSLVG